MARKVRIELVLDAKGVVKGIRKLDGAVDDLDVSVKKTRANFSGFKKFLGAAFLAGAARQAKRFALRMFELGSAAEETESKFRTVFEDLAAGIDDFGNKLANMAGLTKQEFRDLASVVGAIFRGMGAELASAAEESQRVITLAADLASFNNVEIEEAFRAIRAGLTQEAEPLKRFGIVITEAEVKLKALNATGKATEKQLTQLERAQARLNLIYEKAGVQVGDLERTQTSAANEARKFNAIIRDQEQLLAQALLPALNEVRGAFSEAIVENKTFVEAGITLIGVWASAVVKGAEEIIQKLGEWSRALGLINTKTREAVRQRRLFNMLLRSHVTVVDEARAAEEEALRVEIAAARTRADAAAALKVQNKGLVGIMAALNDETRKLAFHVRDLTQADLGEVQALLQKNKALGELLLLQTQRLGLTGAPVEGLEGLPAKPPDFPVVALVVPPEELEGISNAVALIKDLIAALEDLEDVEISQAQAAQQAFGNLAAAFGDLGRLRQQGIERDLAEENRILDESLNERTQKFIDAGASEVEARRRANAQINTLQQQNAKRATEAANKQFTVFKAFAIAESVAATYMAGTKALASTTNPVLGAILAAATIAAGLANVAVIASTSPGGGIPSGGGGSGRGAPADTASTQGAALGGIRIQDRGFTTGALGAARSARAPQVGLTIRVVEPDLFTLSTELSNADGVRTQVGST